MAYRHIILTAEVGLATITFNRPKALNALSIDLLQELDRALEEVSKDDRIRVLLLTGAGDKAFVAGADITEFGKPMREPGLRDVLDRLEDSEKLFVAALHGTALGGGCETALACNYRIAVPSTRIGLVKPNSWMLAAICATCSGLCVLALRS